jgi:hypothetical protein
MVAALLFAWVFGAAGFIGGCNDAMELHRGHVDMAEEVPEKGFGAPDESTRAAKIAMMQEINDAEIAMTSRLYPLSVATFLLGAALVLFAARALAGRSSARIPIIQIAIAQGILSIVAFVLTKHIRDIYLGQLLTVTRDSGGDAESIELMVRYWPRIFRAAAVILLVARNVIVFFIVVALTRTKTKEFFAAMERRFSEP